MQDREMLHDTARHSAHNVLLTLMFAERAAHQAANHQRLETAAE